MNIQNNQIYQGDCAEVLKSFPDNFVASCISDPPYNYEFIGRQWNDSEIQRRKDRVKDSKTMVKNIPYGSGLAGGVRNARWYERNQENVLEYMNWCKIWGKELFRVCKAGAPVAIFNSNRTVAHLQIALEEAGFYTRDVLVYRRNSGIPKGLNLKGKLEKLNHPEAEKWEGWHSCLRNEWEAILLVQKPLLNNYWQTLQQTGVGLFKTSNADGSFQSNILEGFSHKNTEEKFDHCTVKPLQLIKKLIEMFVPISEQNIVLDPFAGSGTTLIAALEMGLPYIGIEIEKNYIPIIEKRIQKSIKKQEESLNFKQ